MRMTKLGRAAVAAAATLALLVMAGAYGSISSAGASSAKGPIVVGVPAALSGGEAPIGQADAKVAQEYVKQINAHGGVHGRKIELKIMDTKTSPTTGLLDVRQMITQDHAVALLGVTSTTLGEDILPLVKRYKIPTLADIGGGTFNHPPSPYFFKIPEAPISVAEITLDYMKEQGLTKIAWLGIDNGFGQEGLPDFRKVAKKNGQKLLDTLMYPPTSTSLTSYLERVKGLPGEQALLIYGIPPTAFIIQGELASAGITVPVFQGNGVALGTFPKAVGAAANGVTVVGGNVNVYRTLPPHNRQRPVIKSFLKLYGSTNRFAGDMYDCVALLVKALRAVGTKGPAIERYLQTKVVRVPGVTGVFTFSSKVHAGVLPSSLSVMRVVNGKFKLIETGAKVLAKVHR
ncbi:MAG: ABC transporter substrate-binding protein [Acidimicrobiales bacterium]